VCVFFETASYLWPMLKPIDGQTGGNVCVFGDPRGVRGGSLCSPHALFCDGSQYCIDEGVFLAREVAKWFFDKNLVAVGGVQFVKR
jgi:hypothetical protein